MQRRSSQGIEMLMDDDYSSDLGGDKSTPKHGRSVS